MISVGIVIITMSTIHSCLLTRHIHASWNDTLVPACTRHPCQLQQHTCGSVLCKLWWRVQQSLLGILASAILIDAWLLTCLYLLGSLVTIKFGLPCNWREELTPTPTILSHSQPPDCICNYMIHSMLAITRRLHIVKKFYPVGTLHLHVINSTIAITGQSHILKKILHSSCTVIAHMMGIYL